MNKIKSSKSFTKLKKNKKRNIVLASLLCGTALAGASIGVSCATNPVPPTPSVYNYVEFAEVETFFAVTGNQLVGFAGTTADQKLASKEGLIDFMEDHPEYNGIDFGNRFASVANSAFTYDEDYNDLKLPECVKAIKFSNDVSINDHAFYICTGLEKVVFGDGNVSIGDGAFVRNASLEEIVFGDGTISIGSTSFGECIKLSKITVDSNAVITSIGENAFSYCLSLRNRDQITITNKNLMGVGHWVGTGSNAYIQKEDGSGSLGSLAFGNIDISSLTSIRDYAFDKCYNLTGVVWPTSLSNISIGSYAFYGTSLSSVILPSYITSIGEEVFAHCRNLVSVDMSSTSIEVINDKSFRMCSMLTNILWPSNLTSIEYQAFADCHSIETIILPSTVISIEREVFAYCENMTSFGFESGNQTLSVSFGHDVFNSTSLNSIDLNQREEGSIEDDTFNLIPDNGTVNGKYDLEDGTLAAIIMEKLSLKGWSYDNE